uniref:Maturase K n=1 Tax=Plagiochila chinensis TaxID=2575588 RepID=A0A4Y5P7K0_9MARC|nr:maturase K [Plagiochila chinensis]QCW58976.1 maturase K [Plagiochila chinensis]
MANVSRELEKIEGNNFRKQRFLYPILFQEDVYGIAYNRFINRVKYQKNKISDFNNEYHFLTLKRLIKKLRQSNYSWTIFNQSINKFQIIQEILIVIFSYIFATESKLIIKKNEWNSNQSIHSIFPFLEDKIHNSTICLDITIPYSFHPEILIRIFRQNISDTSFLHFSRLLLHQNENIDIFHPQFYSRKNQFYNLLWNYQIHKFEYSLIHICKQFYNFQSILFWSFIDQTNFVKKIRYISKQLNPETMEMIIQKNFLIQYARYRNNLIIGTNGNINFFSKNWNLFCLFFWEKYFHIWIKPYRMNIKDFSKNPFFFLGYLFRSKNKCSLINIQLVKNSIDTNLIIKEFCSIIPIIPLIGLLAKEKFCDTSGHPICRVSWTTLTDHEIFRRFDQIIKNIFCYYSGCVKKKGLYQLQYILRFSCAKTLACKHKSTIRTVWKKYGSNFVTNSVHLKKPQSNSWHAYEKKIWYLNIIQINYLANLSHKLKNIRDS